MYLKKKLVKDRLHSINVISLLTPMAAELGFTQLLYFSLKLALVWLLLGNFLVCTMLPSAQGIP